jgi:hypothetical protein
LGERFPNAGWARRNQINAQESLGEGEAMFLILPRSMIIPEILEHLEKTDFEDWLTAALIENATPESLPDLRANGIHSSPAGIADLWMLEITERTGKIWKGKFQVEFTGKDSEDSYDVQLMENPSAEFLFALDTASAEIIFNPDAEHRSHDNHPFPSASLSVPKYQRRPQRKQGLHR